MSRDRNDLLWILVGTLLAGTFALVAYDQLYNLHFSAWRLYTETPSTEGLAKTFRGPISGWYRPFTLVLALAAGAGAVVRALDGRWKSLACLLLFTLIVAAGVEITQSAGQDTTPTSEVDEVAIISLVWTAFLGLIPLGVGLLALSGFIRRDR